MNKFLIKRKTFNELSFDNTYRENAYNFNEEKCITNMNFYVVIKERVSLSNNTIQNTTIRKMPKRTIYSENTGNQLLNGQGVKMFPFNIRSSLNKNSIFINPKNQINAKKELSKSYQSQRVVKRLYLRSLGNYVKSQFESKKDKRYDIRSNVFYIRNLSNKIADDLNKAKYMRVKTLSKTMQYAYEDNRELHLSNTKY